MLGAKVQPGQFAIQKISEKDSAVMEIQLKEINPNKYLAIEQGLSLEKLPTQRENRNAPEAPKGLNIHETMAVENGTLVNTFSNTFYCDAIRTHIIIIGN